MNTLNQNPSTTINPHFAQKNSMNDLLIDQVGKTVARSLELAHLSPKVLQNLEKSREKALSVQKKSNQALSTGFFNINYESFNWLGTLLLICITVFLIADWQQQARLSDIVEVDAAILSDSVPPDAYADDGFKLFLKNMLARAEKANEQDDPAAVANSTEKNREKAPDPSLNQ
jgi:hypothetical protein